MTCTLSVLLAGFLLAAGPQDDQRIDLELAQKDGSRSLVITVRNNTGKAVWFLKDPLPEVARGAVGNHPANFLMLEVVDSQGRRLESGDRRLWQMLSLALPTSCDLIRIPAKGQHVFSVDLKQGPFAVHRQAAVMPLRVRATLNQSVGSWFLRRRDAVPARDPCIKRIPRTAEFLDRDLQSAWLELKERSAEPR